MRIVTRFFPGGLPGPISADWREFANGPTTIPYRAAGDSGRIAHFAGLLSTIRNVPCFAPLEMSHYCGGFYDT
jgi:hypothetical protein